jgi:hypothetical protein
LLVGKEVTFKVTHTAGNLEFGVVMAGQIDVGLKVIEAGWAKLRESGPKDDEDARKVQLKEGEEKARSEGKGLWSSAGPRERKVEYGMPEDANGFLAKYKGQPIDAIIEGVNNGSTVRARLILSPDEHQTVSVGLAGVRAPRAGSNAGGEGSTGAEEFGDEVSSASSASLDTDTHDQARPATLSNLDYSNVTSKSHCSRYQHRRSLLRPFHQRRKLLLPHPQLPRCSSESSLIQQATSPPSFFLPGSQKS